MYSEPGLAFGLQSVKTLESPRVGERCSLILAKPNSIGYSIKE